MPKKYRFVFPLIVAIFFVKACGGNSALARRGGSAFLFMGSLGSEFLSWFSSGETQTATTAPSLEKAPDDLPPQPNLPDLFVKEPIRSEPVKVASNQTTNMSTPGTVLESTATEKAIKSDIQVGIDATSGFIAPTLRFELALNEISTMGAHFSYSKNAFAEPQAQLIGGGFSYSYYVIGRVFRGLSIDGQVNLYDILATTAFRKSHITPGSLTALASWHGKLFQGFNYTAGAGIQYAHSWGTDPGDIEYRTWMPAFKVSIGYEF